MERRIKGYRWLFEITELNGFWSAKAFLGGKLMHSTGLWREQLAAIIQITDLVNNNPYFK